MCHAYGSRDTHVHTFPMYIKYVCFIHVIYLHADTILYGPVTPVCMCVTLDLHLSRSLCLRACLLHLSIHPQRANGNG